MLILLFIGLMCNQLVKSNELRPTNVLGGAEQHASFSFIRPGLTQTSYSFNGPSSHQTFSSSIGNPLLAHKVHPNLAHALTYRNPGLELMTRTSPINIGFNIPPNYQTPSLAANNPSLLSNYFASPYYPSTRLSDHPHQQLQIPLSSSQQYQPPHYPEIYQAQVQTPVGPAHTHFQGGEQFQVQQPQNLLGVAYSSAPSVAHVKINGNGYKFNF